MARDGDLSLGRAIQRIPPGHPGRGQAHADAGTPPEDEFASFLTDRRCRLVGWTRYDCCSVLPNPVRSSRPSSRSDVVAPELISPKLNRAVLRLSCTPPQRSTQHSIVL